MIGRPPRSPLFPYPPLFRSLLGALVPTQAPGWLGAPMLGRLALGTLRYLGPQTHADDVPYIPPTLSAGRLRRGLTVYDGGQVRSEEHTSELQSQSNLVFRPL